MSTMTMVRVRMYQMMHLNLMTTLFGDLEALWWVYRRGLRSPGSQPRNMQCSCGKRWDEGPNAGRIRIDEMTNQVVHCGCWEQHLSDSAREPLCRGLYELGTMWSYLADEPRREDGRVVIEVDGW